MNWTNKQLENLIRITNHKIIYDGYEYVWLSKPDNTWIKQYVDNFEDYNKPMSWIHYCISKWNKEYKKRKECYFSNMIKDLEIDVKIKEISDDYNKKTKQKINQIKLLKPKITNKEIANVLNISIRTVERHLN